jgi:hypothetical protein
MEERTGVAEKTGIAAKDRKERKDKNSRKKAQKAQKKRTTNGQELSRNKKNRFNRGLTQIDADRCSKSPFETYWTLFV